MSVTTFSIVIPSYNEGEDIRLAIESSLAQELRPLEVLVVDDSSDDTPVIVREYADQGVRLVAGEGKGCCGARNLGMRQAKGDVVVLLNGDVRLPADFLRKIARHYDVGADYVLVQSEVINKSNVYAGFVQAKHLLDYGNRTDIEWTEGFSARRSAAEKVGYIPGDYAVRFCRDWMLGRRLKEGGFKKVVDFDIVVTHKAPDTLAEFWRVRVARGRFGAFTQYYIYGRGRFALAAKFKLKHFARLVALVTLVYPLIVAARLARRSARPFANILSFFAAYVTQEVARAVGEWQGVLRAR